MIITTFTVQQLNVTQTFPNHAMRTYKVTYEYRSTVTVEVNADCEKDAEDKGLAEADEIYPNAIHIYSAEAKLKLP